MVTKKKEDPASREYVDQSIDAQRIYAEDLFKSARKRIEASVSESVDAKLKSALETFKPPAKSISLAEANQRAMKLLQDELVAIATRYEKLTGLAVRSVSFGVGVSGKSAYVELGESYSTL